MGLDQYITIRHKSTNNAYKKYDEYWKMDKEERNGIREPKEPCKDITVAYFRKHNMIHGWFVKNVQNGNDDCGRYEITVSQLKFLLAICERVMSYVTKTPRPPKIYTDSKGNDYECIQFDEYSITEEGMDYVKNQLPIMDGFFFGNREYNDTYFWCIENAIKEISFVIEITNKNYFSIYTDKVTGKYTGDWVLEYSSSW